MPLATSRRRVLAAVAGATAAGLAGCLGGSDDQASDGTTTPTDADSVTTTPAADAVDSFCAPITGPATPYDTAGTPFLFTYDYVDSWTVEEPFGTSTSRAQRVVSPTLSSADGESSATIRVAQSLSPVTAADARDTIEFLTDRQENNGVTYETGFNGETIEFVEFPDVDVNSYNTHLPYGDSEERYYSMSIVTLLDGGGPGRTIGDCTDAVNAATRTTLESIAPNPATTIDAV